LHKSNIQPPERGVILKKSWLFLCGQQLEKIRPNREHFCKALESENEQALAYEIFAQAPARRMDN